MFPKILQSLEDPLHPLLGPTLQGLKTWGMWQSNKRFRRTLFSSIQISVIIFVLTQYVELWIIKYNVEEALSNLSLTLLTTVTVAKLGTFVIWKKNWKSVIRYVSSLERRQLSIKDTTTKEIMQSYTKYSRIITYLYWCLVAVSVFTAILAPLANVVSSKENVGSIRNGSASYPEIMSSWVPFDKSTRYGYWILFIEQALVFVYGGGILANYDCTVVVLMTFLAGQLKILKMNCAKLFGEKHERLDYKIAVERIRECHLHHLHLVQNAELINSMLSPVMFMYVIICSFMICASAVQLTTEATTSVQQIWIIEYLISLVAQLFFYCWHSSKVLEMSEQVADGVYASAWWTQDVRVRRSVLLLAGQLNKNIVFTAGPFTDLTVSTFVTILKGSYSYYTLLSNKEN